MRKPWTSEELNLLRKGKIPEGRTSAQCQAQAHFRGIPWIGNMVWTSAEIRTLKAGKIPVSKTPSEIRKYCAYKNIPLPEGVPEKSLRGAPGKLWTPEELKMLDNNQIPPGRTKNESIYACRKYLHKGFQPALPQISENRAARGKVYYEMHKAGKTYAEISKDAGISRQCIHQLVKKYMSTINQ